LPPRLCESSVEEARRGVAAASKSVGSARLKSEKTLTEWVRKVLEELEAQAAKRGLSTPAVYVVAIFDERSAPSERGALKVSDDVLVAEGFIAVRSTEVLPLLVERVAAGYFALSFIASGETPDPDRVRRLAREVVVPVLARLALSSSGA
jgi:hypothetical protein